MKTATAHIKALDLFAGTGWGVACQRLGIKEAGVEIMPEAVATREANGMETIYRDVWDGLTLTAEQHRERYGSYGLLIASPPCQTFSMAGNGKGRDALNEVIEAIELHAYKDAEALKAFGAAHDMRTALVLTPLAYVWRDRPRLVAMEQVPTVLPVWEACAEVMREWGYEVKVEVLNAEQYGVPQTRKRAILVARRGGPVHLPRATHSRYYSRTPNKLDPGVQKWVSMAEALGWTPEESDGSTYTGNNKLAHQAVRSLDQPAPTVTAGHDSGNRGFIDTDGQFFVADVEQISALQTYPSTVVRTSRGTPKADERNGSHELDPFNRPAHTLTSKAESWRIKDGETLWDEAEKLSVDQASALQSYPVGLRSNYGTGGDASNRGERTIDQPAPTLTSKADRNKWIYRNGNQANTARCALDQPAPTLLFGHNSNKVEWMDPELAAIPSASGTRVSVEEAGTLQTYPPFIWCGSKSKQFLQIGNAVPPLLAEHVLAALIGITEGR